jgi:hypothetical protein
MSTRVPKSVVNPVATAVYLEERIIAAQSALGKARERNGLMLTALRAGEFISEVYIQNVDYQLKRAAEEFEKAQNVCDSFSARFLHD